MVSEKLENPSNQSTDKPSGGPLILLKVLRPRQWTKNLIAFAPILFNGRITEPDALISVTICAFSLCLVSGSIYVANDIKDIEADKAHPVKRNRPLASGRISVRTATIVGALALLGGLALGVAVRPAVGLILILYVALQVLYNLYLKKQAVLDIFSIATGFVLRALAGGMAAHVALSGWFLICTSLGALFLGCEKRRQELRVLGEAASEHRSSFDKYSLELLDRMEAVIVPSLVTCYAIYCHYAPSGDWMLITVPFVLYGVFRYQILSTTGSITGSPEEALLKDTPIQLSIVLWVIASAGVVYGWLPMIVKTLIQSVDTLHVP